MRLHQLSAALWAIILGAAAAAALHPTAARADSLLFYNGDMDYVSTATNNRSLSSDNGIYDDFTVATPLLITRLFTNNSMNYTAAGAYYEIRSGVSAGNGGTLLTSGTVVPTQTLTGRTFQFYPEYTIAATLTVPFALGPGTYFMSVRPVDAAGGFGTAGTSSTSGANSVNRLANNNIFGAGTNPGFNYQAITQDFSAGAYFTPSPNLVPTPQAFAGGAMLLGMAGVMAMGRGRSGELQIAG
jgi:hypothetical protein